MPSHVPRALKRLITDGLLTEREGYIEAGTRKSRVYFLSDEGVGRTKKLAERVGAIPVEMKKEGKQHKVALSEINMHVRNKMSLLQLFQYHMRHKVFDLARIESGHKVVDFAQNAPKAAALLGRDVEYEQLKGLALERKVVVVFGWKGVGKTAMASRYLDILRGKHSVFWYQLDIGDTLEDLLGSIAEFLELMGFKNIRDNLKMAKGDIEESIRLILDTLTETDTTLFFDNYHEQGEDIVEFFYNLVDLIDYTKGVRVIFTAREDIPFYNWFYSRKELDRGIVGEIHLKGLDRESGKKILGIKNIQDDAYKQIHQLTKGVPLLLEYIRDDNSEGLKVAGLFTAQEIRHMLALKRMVR